jgi:methyl-accepting chemotaxis protein
MGMVANVLERVTIRARVIALALSAALAVGVISAFLVHFDRGISKAFNTRQTYGEAEGIVSKLEQSFLAMRRHEKEFLSRGLQQDIAAYQSESRTAESISAQLREHIAFDAQPTGQDDRVAVETLLHEHMKAFEKLHMKSLQLGVVDQTGLFGKLRTQASKIEKLVKAAGLGEGPAMTNWAGARKAESDFRLYKKAISLDEMRTRLKDVLAELQTQQIQPAGGQEIAETIRKHADTVETVVAVNAELDAAMQELDLVSLKIEPAMKSLNTLAAEGANKSAEALQATQEQFRKELVVIGVTVLGVMALFSFFIGRSIIRSLAAVAASFDRLTHGEIDVDIAGTGLKNEVGTLARAADSFRQSLLE